MIPEFDWSKWLHRLCNDDFELLAANDLALAESAAEFGKLAQRFTLAQERQAAAQEEIARVLRVIAKSLEARRPIASPSRRPVGV